MSSTHPTRTRLLADMFGRLIDRQIAPGIGARDTRPPTDLPGDLPGRPGRVSDDARGAIGTGPETARRCAEKGTRLGQSAL